MILQVLNHLSRLVPSVLAEVVSTTEHFTGTDYSDSCWDALEPWEPPKVQWKQCHFDSSARLHNIHL